jgi:ATP-dependent Lhr-like helicase
VTATTSSQFDRLAEPVKRWVWAQGWTELRDVQERAIPAVMDGRRRARRKRCSFR